MNMSSEISVEYSDISVSIYEWLPSQKKLYYFPHLFGNYLSKPYFKNHDLLHIYLKFTPYTTIHPGFLNVESCMKLCEDRLGNIFNVYMEEYRWQDFNDSPPLTWYQKVCRNIKINQIKRRESALLSETNFDYPDEILNIREQLITSILIVHHCPHFKQSHKKEYWKIMRYIQALIQHLNDERIYYQSHHELTQTQPPEFPIEMIEWFDYFIHCDFNKIYEFDPPIFDIKTKKVRNLSLTEETKSNSVNEDGYSEYLTDSTVSTNSPIESLQTSIPTTLTNLPVLNKIDGSSFNKLTEFWDYCYEYYRLKRICCEYESPFKFMQLRKDQQKRKQFMLNWKGSGWPIHILELENQLHYIQSKFKHEFYELNSFEISETIQQITNLKRTIESEKSKHPQTRLPPLQLLYPDKLEYNGLPGDLVSKLITIKQQQFPSPRHILKKSIIEKLQHFTKSLTSNPVESRFEPFDTVHEDLIQLEDNDNFDQRLTVTSDNDENDEAAHTQNLSSFLNLYAGSSTETTSRHLSDSTASNVSHNSIFSSLGMVDNKDDDEIVEDSIIQNSDIVSIPTAAIRAIAREPDLYKSFQKQKHEAIASILEEMPWE